MRSDISKQDLSGIAGRIDTPAGSFEFRSSLVGRYNCENILCAAGVAVALDISPATIKAGIENTAVIPGRLEPIPNQGQRFVYVDYAHTPDALKNVLSSLTAIARKQILCVFGCGGDRDQGKRPQMGRSPPGCATWPWSPPDNPRSEPPLRIPNRFWSESGRAVTENTCRLNWDTAYWKRATSWNRIGARPFAWPLPPHGRVIRFSLPARVMKPIRFSATKPSHLTIVRRPPGPSRPLTTIKTGLSA